MQQVEQQVLLSFGAFDVATVYDAPVQCGPPAVRALHDVADHDMGMQVRIMLSRVPMVEPGGGDSFDLYLRDAASADPGHGDVVLPPFHGLVDGFVEAFHDLPAGLVVADCP